MERFLMKKLQEWKVGAHRKPLILWGARQVGKTWLMKEFGKQSYANTVYVSFYNNKRLAEVFDADYDVKRILNAIEVILHVKIDPEDTLLLFDEVQAAPRVVEALKYFCEDAPEYSVIAAGSLLGVSVHEGVSFPVGKVQELYLHPMSFREFLLAMGEEKLSKYVEEPRKDEVREFAEEYREYLKQYMCVGGMPEVVARYAEERDMSVVRELQNGILSQYEGDFGKHVKPEELPRIRMVWSSLPVQLAKENKKFFFGQIREGARAKDYETAIQWLTDAGLVHKVNRVSKPAMPLKSYLEPGAFKLYIVDVGLLGAMSDLDPAILLRGSEIFTEFKGAMAEQYVLQQLLAETKHTPYYYSGSKSTYETDFLIQKGTEVVPIEVKAENNLKSKSLRVYCDKYNPAEAIRLSSADYIDQGWMKNVPLWAAGSI